MKESKSEKVSSEISLKELILTLKEGWKIIGGATALCMGVTLVYLFTIAVPLYESGISGVNNLPSYVEQGTGTALLPVINTKYGNYTLPSRDILEYINVAKSDEFLNNVSEILESEGNLKISAGQIAFKTEGSTKDFLITVKSNSPENAKKLAETVAEILGNELYLTYKQNAIEVFSQNMYVDDKILEDEIRANEQLLIDYKEELNRMTPKILLKKYAASLPDGFISEESINPSFIYLETKMIDLKAEIIAQKNARDHNRQLMAELNAELQSIMEIRESGKIQGIDKENLDILGLGIVFASEASLPQAPISPNKALMTITSFVLGLMLGAFVVMLKKHRAGTE